MARYAAKPAGSPLGKRLEALIESRGMSRTGLAQATGVPVTTLKRLVTETAPNPRLETLTLLSKALGVSMAYLLEGEPQTAGKDPALRETLTREADTFKEEVARAVAQGRLAAEDLELLSQVLAHAVEKNARGANT